MNTSGTTKIRKSSFYLTDAISFIPFVNETRFHNNLFLAQTYAKEKGFSLQDKAGEAGLMPYQYEYDKSLKRYSLTIDLDKVGVDEGFSVSADKKEKIYRVLAILKAIKNLSLVVRGNLDNAEPIFIVGGIGDKKTHYFENIINVEDDRLKISSDLKEKLASGYKAALLEGNNFLNEDEIKTELNTVSIEKFFKDLEDEVEKYYESTED